MRSILLFAMLVLASAVVSPLTASADAGSVAPGAQAEQAATSGTQGIQAGDLPAQSAPARSMRPYWHVFIAFGITWALIFGFALSIGRRFGRLEVEIQRMSGGR